MTTIPFLLCQFGAFCVCVPYLSFFEWAFHRYAFHTPRISRAMFRGHTLVHHQVYKGDSTYQTHDEHPRHVPMDWWALPALLAVNLPIFLLVQWALGGIPIVWGCALAVCVYYGIYESIHWAMHVPERGAQLLGRFRVYRFLDAHHRVHHKHMLSNLNVVLPLADLSLGTLRAADSSRVRLRSLFAARGGGPRAQGAAGRSARGINPSRLPEGPGSSASPSARTRGEQQQPATLRAPIQPAQSQ